MNRCALRAFLHRQRHGLPLRGCSVGLLRALMQQGPDTIQGEVGFLKSGRKTVDAFHQKISPRYSIKHGMKTFFEHNMKNWLTHVTVAFFVSDEVSTSSFMRDYGFAIFKRKKKTNGVKTISPTCEEDPPSDWIAWCSPGAQRQKSISKRETLDRN